MERLALIISIVNVLLVAGLGFAGNSRLERLKGTLQGESDALVRRRVIYEKLAPAIRIFVNDITDRQKRDFEEAYTLAYVWAPEEVLRPLDDFLNLHTVEDGKFRGTQKERNQAYDDLMLSMRKDVHPSTKIRYRRLHF
jgi:hypothetical protein